MVDIEDFASIGASTLLRSAKMNRVLFALFCLLSSNLLGYDVEIVSGPSLDAGPFTFNVGLEPNEDGIRLIQFLGGMEAIDRIVIGTPHANKAQQELTEQSIRRRIESAVSANSKRDKFHYAPFSMGTIYFHSGEKARIDILLSGLKIGGQLFVEDLSSPYVVPAEIAHLIKSDEHVEWRFMYLSKGTRSEGLHGSLSLDGVWLRGRKVGETLSTEIGDFIWAGEWASRQHAFARSGWLLKDMGRFYPSWNPGAEQAGALNADSSVAIDD